MLLENHPETLFVLRAHPDEARKGKASRESVAMWYDQNAESLGNTLLIPPQERVSSYDLARMSKFVLTYNSTIGLEATLLGVPALAAGQAPFNAYHTVFFEPDLEAYRRRLEEFLTGSSITVPDDRKRNTRRFLYYRTYRYSLPFGEFLEPTQPAGYVRLKNFPLRAIRKSRVLKTLTDGILAGKKMELDE